MAATVFKKVRANNVVTGSGASGNEITTTSGALILKSAAAFSDI